MFGNLIAWYLFFGGVAGGVCLAMGIIQFFTWRSTVRLEQAQAVLCGRKQAKAQLRIALAQLDVAKAQAELAVDSHLKKKSKKQLTATRKEARDLKNMIESDEVLVLNYLVRFKKHRMWSRCLRITQRPLLIVATFSALFGSVCLLGDLVRPERAHLLFLQPTFSIINVGAFFLLLFLFVLAALLLRDLCNWRMPQALVVVLRVAAFGLAFALIIYTGVYLNSIWTIAPWSSPHLVALFFFSSLACGIAIPMMVIGVKTYHQVECTEPAHVLAWFDVAFIAGEAGALLAMMIGLGGLSAGSPFTLFFSEELSLPFIGGFLTCGILVPLLFDVIMLRTKNHGSWQALVVGCSTLVGGYFLRFCAIGVSVVYKAIVVSSLGV